MILELEGKLTEIIFQNESNGYTVGKMETEGEEITLVGCMPTLKEGEHLQVKGAWIIHPMYGEQLEVEEYRPILPSSEEGLINYLASGILPGIGKKMAERLVDHFGKEVMEIIEFHPHRLTEVSGIGKKKADAIAEAFEDDRELKEVLIFLSQYGISPNYAVRIYKTYGADTINILQENPYRLAEDIVGIGFITADGIAKSMGIAANSRYRIYAGTRYALNSFHIEGHTYAPKEQLIQRTIELLNVDQGMVEEAIQNLALNQHIQIERRGEDLVVYSMAYYYAETSVCNRLIELSRVKLEKVQIDVEVELVNIQEEEGITLADNQKEAIKSAIDNGIMVITGGPGTGKTTTINTLIKVFEKLEMKITLGAPTGRASKRMTEATGMEAKTIHRLLELGFSEEQESMLFQRDEENPLSADVIIIDEMSMVDILLMHNLMKAVPPGSRLILVGDVDQLPSVGAGNVLRDIIDSRIVKVVRLNEIFRQAEESMIIVNAHKINQGNYPLLNVKDKDFYFLKKHQKEKILETVIQLVKTRLPNHYQYDAGKDIQVLTPMKKGDVGTINLNKELQNALNPMAPWKKQRQMRDKIFRVGDKVMQIKNNYNLKWESQDPDAIEEKGEGVFNGDIGYIQDIDKQEEILTVLFDDDRLVAYNFSQLDELELAYAITIHKSQGSEFPVVVMPVTWGPPMLLTRNLLYTGITRARELVVLVGTQNYLKRMVDNNEIIQRYSGLGYRLGKFFDFHQKQ